MGQPAGESESLRVTEVAKTYGPVTALDRVSLSVSRGEFLTILGPSGSGKTTILKIIAGFEYPTGGTVHLEGRDITFVRPAVRNIGMVFQNYALFPHMTVAENIAFPLRMRKVAKAEMARRVSDALTLVELADYENRLPSQLSGGQQQRVALARAIVFDPPLLLLDEPFGALDRKLREQMQLEVKALQRRLGLTAVFVTHDQEEALLLSDRIAVMSDGALHQVDDPETVYGKPCDRFVADFIGESNLYAASVLGEAGSAVRVRLSGGQELLAASARYAAGEHIHVVIRPEAPVLADGHEHNVLDMTVAEVIFTGSSRKYRLTDASGLEMTARWPRAASARDPTPGDRVRVAIPPEAIHLVQ